MRRTLDNRYVFGAYDPQTQHPQDAQLELSLAPARMRTAPLSDLCQALITPLRWSLAEDGEHHSLGEHWISLICSSDMVTAELVYRRDLSVIQALQAIEAHETAQAVVLPVDVLGTFLVAERGLKRAIDPERVSYAAANLALASVEKLLRPDPPASLPIALTGKQIEQIAERLAPQQRLADFPADLRRTDAARLMLALSRRLWSAAWLTTRELYLPQGGCLPRGVPLDFLATVDLWLRQDLQIKIADSNLRVKTEFQADGLNWLEAIELVAGGIPKETLYALVPDGQMPTPLPLFLPYTKISPAVHDGALLPGVAYTVVDFGIETRRDILAGLASSLVREAEQNAGYVLAGAFRIQIPQEMTEVRAVGLQSLDVVADSQGFWVRERGGVAAGDQDDLVYLDRPGVVFRWQPDRPAALVVSGDHQLVVNAVLAALWHDLRVVGPESVPLMSAQSSLEPLPAKSNGPTSSRSDTSLSKSVRSLPTRRSVHLNGDRQWGLPQERESLARQIYWVRGHVRRLIDQQRRSAVANQIAQEFGMVIPDGFTFVRPHQRGQDSIEHSGPAAPVVVRSKGLASLISLLRQG